MSKKAITHVPGLHRVEERVPNKSKQPLVTKVTGRHLGAVNYLVSLAAERGGHRAIASSRFNDNGSLHSVTITEPGRVLHFNAGDYMFLNHDENAVRLCDAEFYESHYKPTTL